MTIRKRFAVLLAVVAIVALGVVAAGCGSDDNKSASGSSGSGNSADVAFINSMTEHHQSAIDMAKIAKERSKRSEILGLADDIISAQQREIGTMKQVRASLGDLGKSTKGMDMAGMNMKMDMSMLEDAKPFDREFIDMMTTHHTTAIAMAKQQLADGKNPTLRQMAKDIISSQGREIAQMRGWRKAWYGSGPSSKNKGSMNGGSGSTTGSGAMSGMDMGK